MPGKDGKKTNKDDKSDISKGWVDMHSDGSSRSLYDPEALTMVAKTTPFQDFDDVADTDGEVGSPQPNREQARIQRAKRRQKKEEEQATAESGQSNEGKPSTGDSTPPDQTKEDGKRPPGGDDAPGTRKDGMLK